MNTERRKSPPSGRAKPQGTVIEIAILNHALKKGYIHPDYHRQLASWYQNGQLVNGDALFSAICVNLTPEQVESLKTLFDILQIRSQNAAKSVSSSPSESIPAPVDPREQVLHAMEQVLEDHPHFSPQADLFLNVHEKLGEGGMGTVYRVHDKRLERDAALKVIQDQNASPYAIERFLREIKITARLDHPAIPPVYDSGTNVHGQHFMLMRVIEGTELSAMIRTLHSAAIDFQKDKLKIAELLEVLVKVGEAVAYAHSVGIIHRDLKPENILVGRFGEVMVMDWGLAKHMGTVKDNKIDRGGRAERIEELSTQESNLTQAGNLMGTLGYMAPEQAEDCTAVNELADVFSLGAILTEILTGRSPVKGETPIVKLTNTVNGAILEPAQISAKVPTEINAIAAKALKLNLLRRTRTVEDFTADIKRYLAGREVSAYHYTSFEQVLCYVKQNPAVILGAPVLIVVSIIAFSLWLKVSTSPGLLKEAKAKLAKSEAMRGEIEEKRRKMKEKLFQTQQRLGEKNRQLAQSRKQKKTGQSANDWMVQANDFLEKRESLSKIKVACENALKIRKRDTQSLIGVAKLYLRGAYFLEAKNLLKEASVKNESDCEALFLLHTLSARTENRRLEYSSALEELNTRSKALKPNPFLHFARAAKQIKERRFSEARASLARINKYDKDFLWGHYYRAHINLIEGKIELARKGFENVILRQPDLSGAHSGLGQVCLKKAEYAAALVHINRALDLNNHRQDLYLYRSDIREKLGDLNGCRGDLSLVILIDRKNLDNYFRRAAIGEKLNLIESAIEDYGAILKLDATNQRALIARGQLNLTRGQWDRALMDFKVVQKTQPDNAKINILVAKARRLAGDNPGALREIEAAIRLDPIRVDAYVLKGLVLLDLEKFDLAMTALNKAISIDSNCADAYYHRSLLHSRQGSKEAAKADAVRLLSLEPNRERSLEIGKKLLWPQKKSN